MKGLETGALREEVGEESPFCNGYYKQCLSKLRIRMVIQQLKINAGSSDDSGIYS